MLTEVYGSYLVLVGYPPTCNLVSKGNLVVLVLFMLLEQLLTFYQAGLYGQCMHVR